jgi:hypothetical protein
LKELYKSKELDRDRPENVEADFEEVAASCGHFSFSLQTFANEMQTYLSILEDLKDATENRDQRSWKWVQFWRESKAKKAHSPEASEEEAALIDQHRNTNVSKDPPDLIFERPELRKQKEMQRSNVKQGFYRRILRLLRTLARDDGKHISGATYLFLLMGN